MIDLKSLDQQTWLENEKMFGGLTDKQWKILKAALKVFAKKGYSAATTSEIAREAGIAEGTIFRHFKTKKDILLATLIPLTQNFVSPRVVNPLQNLFLQNDNLPIEEVVYLVIEERQQLITDMWPLLRIIIIEANFHPELKEALIRTVVALAQETMLTFLQKRQKIGELRDDIDVWVMMRSLVGAAAFYFASKSLFPEYEQDKNQREEIRVIVDLFLQGAKKQS